MKKLKSWKFFILILVILTLLGLWIFKKSNLNPNFSVGQKIDSLNDVFVYYNGGVGNVEGRNTTSDRYNLGLKYQCVEFVKRYYYEYFNHKMPDSYGNAKDFFDINIPDGQNNKRRNLVQYTNPSKVKPKLYDLLIFKGTIYNKYGHVAIVSKVTKDEIEIIQQNPGPYGNSREVYKIEKENKKWRIKNNRILGWLRKDK